jgi:hypothetical protein
MFPIPFPGDYFHLVYLIYRYQVQRSWYAMPVSILSQFSFSPDTFTLCIAPSAMIHEALKNLLTGNRDSILYLCGNYPVILPSIAMDPCRFRVRRALTAYQVLSILEETDESLTLFEHDRSLYDDNENLFIPIGERCRQRAGESGTVILFAVRTDPWLHRLEPYAHRVVFFSHTHSVSIKPGRTDPVIQQTLEGI